MGVRHTTAAHNHTDADQVAELTKKIDLLIELMCPKCGPAAVVRMHPELGPTPLGPGAFTDPSAALGNKSNGAA